jgi:hypothetical protein
MKETFKRLRTLATIFLTETQANTIERYVQLEAWQSLRIYISDIVEDMEIKLLIKNGDNEGLQEWLMIEEMNDIAIDIAIQMSEKRDETTQSRRRKRIVRS